MYVWWFSLFCSLALAKPTAKPIEIQFWHSMSGEKSKTVGRYVGQFNQQHLGEIKVEAQFVGSYSEGMNKLRTALMVDRGPQVAQIYDIGTQLMIDSGAIIPLHEFTKDDKSFNTDEILRPLRQYYEFDGKMYSLPFASSNAIVYYNADLFDQYAIKAPPSTFEEFEAVAKKLSSAEKKQTGATWPLHGWFFEQFMAKQGQTLVNQSNGRKGRADKVHFASPEGIRFVTFWRDLVRRGYFADVGRGWEPAVLNFLAGRSAMLITSTSDVFEIVKKASFKVKTAPLPRANSSDKSGVVVGGNSLWILKSPDSEVRRASYELVKFLGSAAIQTDWHKSTGYFPIRSPVIETLEKKGFYKENPAALTAINQLRSSADSYASRGALMGVFPEAREHVESAIEQVLSKGEDVKVALSNAARKTERALSRYNRARQRRLKR